MTVNYIKLTIPELTEQDKILLKHYCSKLGYKSILNNKQRKFIIENKNGKYGYIQKSKKDNNIYYVFRNRFENITNHYKMLNTLLNINNNPINNNVLRVCCGILDFEI
ncbi:hypothetical protein CCP3SC1AL1_2530006 [Gammaproteobacteria bacterium]